MRSGKGIDACGDFFDIAVIESVDSIKACREHDIARIAGVDAVLSAEEQAGGRGYHDEHHCCEHADGRESRAVSLHSVGH